MDRITELKAEIFDIIRRQEQLNAEFNKLEQIKRQKVVELEKIEQGGLKDEREQYGSQDSGQRNGNCDTEKRA